MKFCLIYKLLADQSNLQSMLFICGIILVTSLDIFNNSQYRLLTPRVYTRNRGVVSKIKKSSMYNTHIIRTKYYIFDYYDVIKKMWIFCVVSFLSFDTYYHKTRQSVYIRKYCNFGYMIINIYICPIFYGSRLGLPTVVDSYFECYFMTTF